MNDNVLCAFSSSINWKCFCKIEILFFFLCVCVRNIGSHLLVISMRMTLVSNPVLIKANLQCSWLPSSYFIAHLFFFNLFMWSHVYYMSELCGFFSLWLSLSLPLSLGALFFFLCQPIHWIFWFEIYPSFACLNLQLLMQQQKATTT